MTRALAPEVGDILSADRALEPQPRSGGIIKPRKEVRGKRQKEVVS